MLRSAAARGRAGLHMWSNGLSIPLPPLPSEICEKETRVCLGVSSATLYSKQSHQLLHATLDSTSSQWRTISLPRDDKVGMVASGLSHSLMLSASGQVYSFGGGYFGQRGCCSSVGQSLSEVKGLEERSVKQVVCGLDHSLFLLANGAVLACGWSADGQTGTGSYKSSDQLLQVDLGSEKANYLATCADSSFAMMADSEVFAWGNNEYRQLGVASTAPQLARPHPVATSAKMDGSTVTVVAGGAFVGFLTSRGSVYLRGYSIDGVQAPYEACRKIHDGDRDGRVVRLEAGLNYMAGFTSPCTGLLWGKVSLGDHQQLIHSPTRFSVAAGVLSVTCGPLALAALSPNPLPQPLMAEQ